MGDEPAGASQMRAITISRQYGSGGGEIAARIAGKLGWQLIDHQIIARVAHVLGITEEDAHARDERVDRFVSRVVSTLRGDEDRRGAAHIAHSHAPAEEAYYETVSQVVETAAQAGHAVIVGRGGQVLLRGQRDVLHVRVVAPLSSRIAYVARREGLDEAAARTRIQVKDRDRVRFLQVQHHCDPDDPLYYDLIVNSGVLRLESAVDLICLALGHKAELLGVPEHDLGPAAGLPRYPSMPDDLDPLPPGELTPPPSGGAEASIQEEQA